MSNPEDEREKIRQQKKEKLLQGGANTGDRQEPPSEPIEISGQDHFREVVETYDVVLVDCYADWCGPCKMMDPVVKQLASTSDAAVAKLDVDANQALAGQLGARSIPTFIVFANGEPVQRMVGAQDKAALQNVIQSASA